MTFRKRPHASRLFRLQDDGRFEHLGRDGSDADLEQFLTMGDGSRGRGRGSVPLNTSINARRLRTGLYMMMGVALLFLGRSVQLQVIEGESYAERSNQNRESIERLVPTRGIIFDRFHTPLAWNEPAFVLTMTAADLPKGEARTTLFAQVADSIGSHPTELDLLLTRYANRPYEPIPVEDDLPYESAIRLAGEVSGFPGFGLVTRTKRLYVSGTPSLSHILGYTGTLGASEFDRYETQGYRLIDVIGKLGVEQAQEALLRGIPGKLLYEVDALGTKRAILSKELPTPGSNLTLSLDAEFQQFIEKELSAVFARSGASRGSVVALDPSTGAIRALVSLPTFEANEFTAGLSQERYDALLADPDNPFFFRGISGEFASGSTFKPVVAYAALAEGIVSEHTSFVSTGGLRVGEWFFPDWRAGGHGVTDARKAISESVNTYFYIIGGGFDTVRGLGVDRIAQYARRFGFGAPTGIDLPSEADGFLPSKEWKEMTKGERWYVGDTYHLAIGQGDFLTTPLQMAVATAAFANGGLRVTPYVVESADGFGSNNISHASAQPIEELDAFALLIVRQGMRQAVTEGSARALFGLQRAVAGKTGTAQTPGDRPFHSWFTGFGPYEDPDLALVVLIEEGGESTDAAVPLARQIFEWWFENGGRQS